MRFLLVALLFATAACDPAGRALVDDQLRPVAGARHDILVDLASQYRIITVPNRPNYLGLHQAGITDDGLDQICSSLNAYEVRELNLNDQAISDRSAAVLCRIRSLRVLHVNGTAMTAAGLSGLGDLPHLETLFVERGQFVSGEIALIRSALKGIKVVEAQRW